MNQYNSRGGAGGQSQLRVWLNKHNVGLGDTVSVLAAIEYFKGNKQLTVHKLRLIRDVGEEMLQQQTILMGQKVFFDPCVPYKFRIAKCAFGERPDFSQPDYQVNRSTQNVENGANEINMFSIMRVKKVIADYIMREHISLFTSQKTHADAIQQKIIVSREDILKNYLILSKTKAEIRMSAEPEKDPHLLVDECVQELWERGFLVRISPDGDTNQVFRI